ncbi:MAG: radical SAM protein [Candidatus Lindowbacteria bacterium]|nr:radical SAM protein [Candidatus Lindowbacteria bacterium]
MRPLFHILGNVLRANVTTPPYPYKITIAVTYRCNSRCLTCGIWKRGFTPEMSLEDFDRFFRANPGLAWLDLTGGEVFLRKDFVAICAAAIRHCPNLALLHFPTNGLLVDHVVQGTRDILALHPNRLIVSVSLDGPRELHDKIRGGKGFFDRAVATIRQLRTLASKRFQVFPGMTLSRENLGQIDSTLIALRNEIPDFRPAELHVNIAQVSEHFYGNKGMDLSFQSEALQEIHLFSRKRRLSFSAIHALENAYLNLAERYIETGKTPMSCQALSSSCFIHPDGRTHACVADNEAIGMLSEFDYDLRNAWMSEKFVRVRRRIQRGECPQCWTPCEAYQTICSRLSTLAKASILYI